MRRGKFRLWLSLSGSVASAARRVAVYLPGLVRSAPLTIPIGLMAFGAVATGLLVLDSFHTWPILVLGSLAAAVAMILAHKVSAKVQTPGSSREQAVCNALLIVGVLLWIGVNIPFSSQHLFTDRDPATYAVAGAWLVTHDTLRIPTPQGFSEVPGVNTASLGFSPSTHSEQEIYAQGSHILPAFLGITGRLLGFNAMLSFNILIGAAALLAVYGFARLIMRPRWALAATATLAVSLPLFYFARDTYTEPLALLCIFSSLTMLWYAMQTGRSAAWLLAGLALGTGLLARIDTLLPVAAICFYLAYLLCVAPRHARLALLRRQAIFAVSVGLLGVLAWLDLSLLSSGYYRDLRPQYVAELLLIAGVVLIGVIAVWTSWQFKLLQKLDTLTRHWRARAVTIALSLFFVFLASRSLWQTNYALKGDTMVRSYAEHSLIWMSWYLGPAVAILGIVATVLVWRRLMQGRLVSMLPFMLVMAACTMYLVNPNISSDQVWASRRFLPVILPSLTILCFLLLEKLYDRRSIDIRGYVLHPQVIASSAATLALIGPLFVSLPFTVTRTYAPQLSQVQFLCQNIPDNAVVVWLGEAQDYSIQPTQAFCGVPSVGIDRNADLAKVLPALAEAGRQQGKQIVIGVKNDDTAKVPAEYRQAMTINNTIAYADIEQTYKKFPRNRVLYTQTLTFGSLTPVQELAVTPSTSN